MTSLASPLELATAFEWRLGRVGQGVGLATHPTTQNSVASWLSWWPPAQDLEAEKEASKIHCRLSSTDDRCGEACKVDDQ